MGKDNSSGVTQKLKPYEMQRMQIIVENASILKAKGCGSLFNKDLQKKYARVASSIETETCQSEEEITDPPTTTSKTDSVQANVNNARGRKERQSLVQTLPMADFVKVKAQERQKKKTSQSQPLNMIHEQGLKQTQQQKLTRQQENQERKQEAVHMSTNQKRIEKSYCPPGCHSQYLQMMKAKASKRQQGGDVKLQSLEAELLRSSEGLRQPRDVGDADLDMEDAYEIYAGEDVSNNQNEVASEPDLAENENPVTKKKGRGKTILQEILNRNVEDREPIVLNDKCQPIGPTKEIAKTFSNFLGTVARDANLVPPNYVSWRYVPDKTKDNIWEYIQKRYDVLEVGKKWVLSTISNLWRNNKCDLKEDFYTDKTPEERLKYMPDSVPETQWKDLVMYWDTPEVQETSKKNKNNRDKQSDMHTLGSTSYAILRHEMQQNDPQKREPSQTDVYMESRKRKVGRSYLTSNDETLQNIEKMKALKAKGDGSGANDPYYDVITKKEHSGRLRLCGRGVTQSSAKNKAKTGYILPSVFLESITQTLEKRWEDQLEKKMSDMLSKIKQANPGVELVIPDFQAMEPSQCDNVGDSSD